MMKIIYILLLAVLINQIPDNALGKTTVFDFLNIIPVQARPGALSGTYCGLADDVSSINLNPAGIGRIIGSQIGYTHNEWLDDVKSENIVYGRSLNSKKLAVGGSLTYLHMGKITGRDIYGRATEDFSSYDIAFSLAFSRMIAKGHYIGLNLKYLHEQILEYSANGVAIDFGSIHKTFVPDLFLGFKVENLGPEVKFIEQSEPLPTKVCVGASYRLVDGLNLALDTDLYQAQGITEIKFGTEYAVHPLLTLRLGYRNSSMATPFSLGVGFNNKYYNIDYAFIPFGVIGDTHRITLTFKIGPSIDVKGATRATLRKYYYEEKNNPEKQHKNKILDEIRTIKGIKIDSKYYSNNKHDKLSDVGSQILITLTQQAIFYELGSSGIKTVNYAILDKLAELIKCSDKKKLEVKGYTCDIGTDEFNLKLSEERAYNVAKYLSDKSGVPLSDFKIAGYGKTCPIDVTHTEEGRNKNRRVEIVIE